MKVDESKESGPWEDEVARFFREIEETMRTMETSAKEGSYRCWQCHLFHDYHVVLR